MELTDEEIADLKKAHGIEDEPEQKETQKKSFKDALLAEDRGRSKTRNSPFQSALIHKDLTKIHEVSHDSAIKKGNSWIFINE